LEQADSFSPIKPLKTRRKLKKQISLQQADSFSPLTKRNSRKKSVLLEKKVEEVVDDKETEDKETENKETEDKEKQISEINSVFLERETIPSQTTSSAPETNSNSTMNSISSNESNPSDKSISDMELKKQELLENEITNTPDYLYPDLTDPDFNKKITRKQEFQSHKYNGTIYDNPKEKADEECNAEFEILPHQQFVRNFMSSSTPYNSLLLYHELGTGKTCSAIGIAEEMREYIKQVGIEKEIYIIASPNVLENFKLQLFDPSKLKEIKMGKGSSWNLQNCVGNTLLKEINPMQTQGVEKEVVIALIESLIRKYYRFMGYEMFANRIIKKVPEIKDFTEIKKEDSLPMREQKKLTMMKIQRAFDHRLFIVDEAHNMIERGNKLKVASEYFKKLVSCCRHLRLLFLSATPMYNSFEEIIWLLNIMHLNDRRPQIKISDVFESSGEFTKEKKLNDIVLVENGRDLLKRKLTGYVSYVRGENPYTFPYRMYPEVFAEKEYIMTTFPYPTKQLNGVLIPSPQKHVIRQLYKVPLGEYQLKIYKQWASEHRQGELSAIVLNDPLNILNIVYPHDNEMDTFYHGEKGLQHIMTKTTESPHQYKYSNKKYERLFQMNELKKYSGKIAEICKRILSSTGIVLIYSRYIEGGIVPLALALEELGLLPYERRELLNRDNFRIPLLNVLTMKPKQSANDPVAKYVMITGDYKLSPTNISFKQVMEKINSAENKDGSLIKVVLISDTGSEGLDFKCIRQVHILHPWYNMNQMEQIIGRAVRNKSHCRLPYEQRNVELYMYTSVLEGTDQEEEVIDMYIYRKAEEKALLMGKVNRVMKECAVDCLLNEQQMNFARMNNKVTQILSTNKKEIQFQLGDKPFSSKCDYLESCEWSCSEKADPAGTIDSSTYQYRHLKWNHSSIARHIRDLFRDRVSIEKKEMIQEMNALKPYPLEQILYSISVFLRDKNEWLVHKNKKGYMIEMENEYLFQPHEITDQYSTIYERTQPYYKKITGYNEEIDTELPIKKTRKKKIVGRENESELGKKGFLGTKKKKRLAFPNANQEDLLDEDDDDDDEDDDDDDDDDEDDDDDDDDDDDEERDVYNKIEKQLEFIMDPDQPKIHQDVNQPTYYEYAKMVMDILIDHYEIPLESTIHYFLLHILDSLLFSQKLDLLELFFTRDNDFKYNMSRKTDWKTLIKNYFMERMLQYKNTFIIYLTNGKKNVMYIWKADSWLPYLGQEDETIIIWKTKFDLSEKIREKILNEQNKNIHISPIGFVTLANNKDESDGYVFKYKKDLSKWKNTESGSRCDQADKKLVIQKLNEIGKDHYTTKEKETKLFPETKPKYEGRPIEKVHFCVMYEVLLRHFNDKKHFYFVSPEEAIESKLLLGTNFMA